MFVGKEEKDVCRQGEGAEERRRRNQATFSSQQHRLQHLCDVFELQTHTWSLFFHHHLEVVPGGTKKNHLYLRIMFLRSP